MKSFAVIFNYLPDDDSAVYLFNTEQEAKKNLRSFYDAQMSIKQDPGWVNHGSIAEDNTYARITSRLFGDVEEDVTEIRLGRVFV